MGEIADWTASCAERASCGRRLLAEGARPLHHPLEVDARRRVGARDQPDREARDHRVDPGLQERDPHRDADDHGDPSAPLGRCEPQREQRREQRGRHRERDEVDVLRVRRGDHDQRHEVVDHRQRQQPEAQARAARRHEREDAERERRVGRHRRAPAVRPGAARVEREIDRDRDRHAAERRQHGDGQSAPLAELPLVELPLGLEADDEEVEGHQALVDPLAQVVGDARAAEPDRQLRRPDRLVGVRPRRVRPHERRDRRREQRRRAGGLGVEEVADRRREVARPCGTTARGHACRRRHPDSEPHGAKLRGFRGMPDPSHLLIARVHGVAARSAELRAARAGARGRLRRAGRVPGLRRPEHGGGRIRARPHERVAERPAAARALHLGALRPLRLGGDRAAHPTERRDDLQRLGHRAPDPRPVKGTAARELKAGSAVGVDAELDGQREAGEPDHRAQHARVRVADHDRPEPAARQQAEGERHGRVPVHGAEHDEGERRDGVRDAEHDVLERVAARQRVAGAGEHQREHHHAGASPEVAAVDRDHEHAGDQAGAGVVACLGGREALSHQDRQRGRADQPRRDPLERVRRRQEQQARPHAATQHGRDRELPHARRLASQLGLRAERRADADEHERDRVRHVGGHRVEADRQQGGVARQRRQARDAPGQPGHQPGAHQQQQLDAGHRRGVSQRPVP